MPYRTVCISSEDGAGALGAAHLAARALGLRLIDEDIVTRAAQEAGVERDVVADVEQRRSRLERLLEGLGASGMGTGYTVTDAVPYTQPASDELRGLIRSVIEDTAEAGDVMIVSHAASLALAGREGVLRVFITASPATRASRRRPRSTSARTTPPARSSAPTPIVRTTSSASTASATSNRSTTTW